MTYFLSSAPFEGAEKDRHYYKCPCGEAYRIDEYLHGGIVQNTITSLGRWLLELGPEP
jgi:hypothetical protein